MLVDAWVGVDQLRSLVWWAAWAADNAPDEFPLAASAAKAYAARVFEQAAETVIQVHGGIGFTWEHDAHLYWRRAKVDRLLLGDEAEHLDAVAAACVGGARRSPAGLGGSRRGSDDELTELRYDVEDGVATVTLHRPERLNAFTLTMADELATVAAAADADDAVRVVVVTGAGRAFCAGADLGGGPDTFADRRTRDGRRVRSASRSAASPATPAAWPACRSPRCASR